MTDKVCTVCKISKDISCFSKKGKGLQSSCKECVAIYGREWHQKHKLERNITLSLQKENRREKARSIVFEILKESCCIDCGEKDILVLDFDHISGEKDDCISRMMNNGDNVEDILKEIEKCVVRCANCHRRKTAKDFGWHRLLYKNSII